MSFLLPGGGPYYATRVEGKVILEGQVALITGSGQGIGKTIALRFADEGADIGVLEVDPKTASATVEAVRRTGRRASVAVADVTDAEAVRSAVVHVVDELGRLDILVNNAGIEKRTPFLEI